ncbi:hypothetical protein FS749_003039 [Ceratobasidium sp. UAMH 11750]|nr:hypothetical protein FS749_003039 [Ceratobasidium sp. UAMH 11750]
MDEESAARAREKARRAHRTMEDSVACFCEVCKGDEIPPRTERSHRKRARWQRPLPPNVAPPQQPLFESRASLSPSPAPRSPPLPAPRSPSLPAQLSQPPSPLRSNRHASPTPPLPGSLPPSLPGSPSLSLHSSGFLSRESSPGARQLIPRLENEEPDGDLSDLAEEEDGLNLGRGNFFERLLDQGDYQDDARSELELEALPGDPPSPNGSELARAR